MKQYKYLLLIAHCIPLLHGMDKQLTAVIPGLPNDVGNHFLKELPQHIVSFEQNSAKRARQDLQSALLVSKNFHKTFQATLESHDFTVFFIERLKRFLHNNELIVAAYLGTNASAQWFKDYLEIRQINEVFWCNTKKCNELQKAVVELDQLDDNNYIKNAHSFLFNLHPYQRKEFLDVPNPTVTIDYSTREIKKLTTGNAVTVKIWRLLKNNFALAQINKDQSTPFINAIKARRFDLLPFVYESATLDHYDQNRSTALMHAIDVAFHDSNNSKQSLQILDFVLSKNPCLFYKDTWMNVLNSATTHTSASTDQGKEIIKRLKKALDTFYERSGSCPYVILPSQLL